MKWFEGRIVALILFFLKIEGKFPARIIGPELELEAPRANLRE